MRHEQKFLGIPSNVTFYHLPRGNGGVAFFVHRHYSFLLANRRSQADYRISSSCFIALTRVRFWGRSSTRRDGDN